MSCVCMCPWSPEEGWIPRARVLDSCELLDNGCWGRSTGPYQQQMLLTAEPLFGPLAVFFFFFFLFFLFFPFLYQVVYLLFYENWCFTCVNVWGFLLLWLPGTKPKLWREGFIEIILPDHRPSLREVRTETKAGLERGADAEAMEGCCLLACFIRLSQPAFL